MGYGKGAIMSLSDFNATQLAKLDPEVVSALIQADTTSDIVAVVGLIAFFVLMLWSM